MYVGILCAARRVDAVRACASLGLRLYVQMHVQRLPNGAAGECRRYHRPTCPAVPGLLRDPDLESMPLLVDFEQGKDRIQERDARHPLYGFAASCRSNICEGGVRMGDISDFMPQSLDAGRRVGITDADASRRAPKRIKRRARRVGSPPRCALVGGAALAAGLQA